MALLKKVDISAITPKPKLTKKPLLSKKKDSVPSIKGLVGLSYYDIEKVIEEEYIRRGILLLRFEPTHVRNFKISSDGRFGIESNEAENCWILYIFNPHLNREHFVDAGSDAVHRYLRYVEAHRFYYNSIVVTADAQIHNISDFIMRKLGSELEEKKRLKQKEIFEWEDKIVAEGIKKVLEEEPEKIEVKVEMLETTESSKILEEIIATESNNDSFVEIAQDNSRKEGLLKIKELNSNEKKGSTFRLTLNI